MPRVLRAAPDNLLEESASCLPDSPITGRAPWEMKFIQRLQHKQDQPSYRIHYKLRLPASSHCNLISTPSRAQESMVHRINPSLEGAAGYLCCLAVLRSSESDCHPSPAGSQEAATGWAIHEEEGSLAPPESHVQVLVDGAPVRIQLCDTAGQEDFDHLRSLCYPETDVFLVCFSVVNPSSFQNVTEKWIPEIRTHSPHTPVVLVGTQADLRDDVNVLIRLNSCQVRPVSELQAQNVSQKIRAHSYIECSALTQKNLKEVFDTAIIGAIEHKARLEKKLSSKGFKRLSKCRWKKYFCFV